MVNGDHRYVNLAPGELDNCQPAPAHTMRDSVVPVGAGNPRSLKLLGQRRGHLVAQDIDVPPGWSDIVNVLLAAFSKSPGRIDWVRGWCRGLVGQLVVGLDAKRSHAYQLGAVAFAANVAAFIDPVTGACGPVNDSGLPEWWQRLAGSHAGLPEPWGTYNASGLWCSRIDSYTGLIPGHPAGSLMVAAHHEAGSIQLSVKPSVAHTMREKARRQDGIGCAALLAEMISLPSARPHRLRQQSHGRFPGRGGRVGEPDAAETQAFWGLGGVVFHAGLLDL
jgi:hypothetical protein